MILDPRLVPWSDILPGVGAAATVAGIAFFLRRWRLLFLFMLTAAPVIGWAVAIRLMRGKLPSLPPLDATLWTFYLSAAGVIFSGYGIWRPRWLGCLGGFARMLYLPALWYCIFRPVFHYDAASLGWKILAFGLTGAGIMALWHRRAGHWPAAEFAPWLLGLAAASICLSLTGTASVAMLALSLCLAAIPGAIIILVDSCRKHQITPEIDKMDAKEPQAFTLPLAFAFPALACSGPLYASTPWPIACLLLAAPVAGFIALRSMAFYMKKRSKHWPHRGGGWKYELAAIAIALIATAVPAGVAAWKVITAAAMEEPYY